MIHIRLSNWNKPLFALLLCLALCSCSTARRDSAFIPPPVTYEHIVRRDPNYSIHVVRINLADPRVSVSVARGGPDPDGNGPWLTTLMPTSEIAEREHFDVAINGDFFDAEATKDIEGRNTGYVRGKAAAPVGTAMTDGALWHRAKTARPYLEFTDSKVARLEDGRPTDAVDPAGRQIVGGGPIIVRDGQSVVPSTRLAAARHPRTAVGMDVTGRQLVLLVVDGRQPSLSVGMTLTELAEEMIRLGCYSAINLDGGGSSTMVYRNPTTKKLEVLNSPSDTKERSVADVLGFRVANQTRSVR